MTAVESNLREAVAEIAELAAAIDPAELEALRDAVLAADAVFLTGAGRSGLMSRAIAMRLMHIGLKAYAVGEVSTPAIGDGDLLVAFSARGGASTVALMTVARKSGARVAAFTSTHDTAVAEAADVVVAVPARVKVASAQHAGSLFEQTCLVAGDALCRSVQDARGATKADLDQRHANLI